MRVRESQRISSSVEKIEGIRYHDGEWFSGDLDGMAGTITFPPVTDQFLVEVVRRILTIGSPIKIVLFGSHAKGTARPDSDLDLLIIEESDLPRYRRSGRYRRVLCGVFPAKDIVVWTPQEVEEWKTVPNAFISTVLAEGKLLYER